MTDNTQPERFRFDFARLERIKDQIERGEEISAEDVEYVREFIRVVVAVLEPVMKAIGAAVKEFAQRIAQLKAPASHQVITGTTTRPIARADLDLAVQQVKAKDRRYTR